MTPALSLLVGASCLIPGVMSAQVFSGIGTGDIPDGVRLTSNSGGDADFGTPLLVTFDVNGLANPIGNISLSITLNHHFAGDLDVALIPPSGGDGFVIFSRVGQVPNALSGGQQLVPFGSSLTFGDYSDLAHIMPSTFVFSDGATGNLWSAAGFDTETGVGNYTGLFEVPAGSYRTSVAGPWDQSGNPNGGNHSAGQFTSFAADSGFIGMNPNQANGTWTLRIRDGASSDVGAITDAALTITPVPEPARYTFLAGLGLIIFAGYRRFSQAKA